MEYSVVECMHFKHEPRGFSVNMEEGTKEYLFLHFINPVDIRVGGKMMKTAPHACIIYSPYTPHYFVANSHEMLHDWITFVPANKTVNIQKIGVPINKIFYTDMGNQITKIVESIQWEYNRDNDIGMSYTLSNLFELLRNENLLHQKSSLYSAENKFNELRALIYDTPKNWNIQSMAEYVHLSRSRFVVKYKEIFGISPIDDLGEAVICMAKKLLTTTEMTVQNISYECGYSNNSYFILKFKTKTGLTPEQFRKENK